MSYFSGLSKRKRMLLYIGLPQRRQCKKEVNKNFPTFPTFRSFKDYFSVHDTEDQAMRKVVQTLLFRA